MASGLFPFEVRPASLYFFFFFFRGGSLKMGDAGEAYRFRVGEVVSGFWFNVALSL